MAELRRDPDDLPEAEMGGARRRVQLVWIIPIVAALIGAWLAVKTYLEKGPTATITFVTAESLEAGKTKIKYKDVDIGEIESVAVSDDDQHVVATAQFQKAATKYLVKDTRFWVVRPRLGLGGVSGLGTLFSGAYLAIDVGKSREPERNFTGLEIPPIVTANLAGREFVLHADSIGSLGVGSPLYFRHIQAGQVIAFDLDADGKGVTLRVFVNGPYDKFVTNNTRFWNASGIDISLDANGLRFDSESLASILAGGIAFEDPPDSTSVTEAEAGTKFALVATRQVAMKLPDREVQTFLAYFGDELRGLSPGAPVDFGGVVVGEVKSITIEYDPQAKLLRFPVQIDIYPDRLRARFREGTRTAEEIAKEGRVLDDLIERGYRLQLRTGNLLTGQLYVAFARFSEAPKAALDRSKTPPVLPTTPSGLRALQETVAKLGNKLDDLPLEEIAADARQTLQTLTRTLESTDALVKRVNADVTPEVQAMLQDARQTLASADHQLSARSPALVQVQQAMAELERAAQALRVLAETLQRQPESLIHGKKGDAP